MVNGGYYIVISNGNEVTRKKFIQSWNVGILNVRNWKTIKSCSFRRKDPKNYHYIYILTKIWNEL